MFFHHFHIGTNLCSFLFVKLNPFKNGSTLTGKNLMQGNSLGRQETILSLNPLHTGRLFLCYVLEETFCHFRGGGSIVSLLFFFLMENPVANSVDQIRCHIMYYLIWVCTVCL